MTEEEAKKKWCPQARIEAKSPSGKAAINRTDSSDEHRRIPSSSKCIASSCMAWRMIPSICTNDPQKGYCGLAGKL